MVGRGRGYASRVMKGGAGGGGRVEGRVSRVEGRWEIEIEDEIEIDGSWLEARGSWLEASSWLVACSLQPLLGLQLWRAG